MKPGDLVACYSDHRIFVGGIFELYDCDRNAVSNMIDGLWCNLIAIVVYVDGCSPSMNTVMIVTTGTHVGWTWASNWEKIVP